MRLSWLPGGPCDAVEVWRDGALIATLPGNAVFFEEALPGPGTFAYAVICVRGNGRSAAQVCQTNNPTRARSTPPRALRYRHRILLARALILPHSWRSRGGGSPPCPCRDAEQAKGWEDSSLTPGRVRWPAAARVWYTPG